MQDNEHFGFSFPLLILIKSLFKTNYEQKKSKELDKQ